EAVLQLDRPVAPVLKSLSNRGILGGLDLSGYFPELGDALLVCATETKTSADIDRYRACLSEAMQAARAARGFRMPVPEKLIFEYSHAGRGASDQWPHAPGPVALSELPAKLRRVRPPELPEV